MKYEMVALDEIHADMDENYRSDISKESIRDLHKSFVSVYEQTNGSRWMLNPVMLVKMEEPIEGKEYRLRVGFRRFLASKYTLDQKPRKYNWAEQIPAIVQEETAEEQPTADHFLRMIENIQREDVSPLDEGYACQKALDESDMSMKELGQKLGRTKGWVSQRVALLDLADDVQAALSEDKITLSHARQLYRIEDKEAQCKLLDLIWMNDWGVRDLKHHVARLRDGNPTEQTQFIAEGLDSPLSGGSSSEGESDGGDDAGEADDAGESNVGNDDADDDDDAGESDSGDSAAMAHVRELNDIVSKVENLQQEVERVETLKAGASEKTKPVYDKQTAYYAGAQSGIAWVLGKLDEIDYEDIEDDL